MAVTGKFQFAIDRGGTFTDIWCRRPDGTDFVYKLLSENPEAYADAPTEGIRRILAEEGCLSETNQEGISSASIDWIRMGTTVATNALLERKGDRTALLVTRGFKDLLFIGNQARPDIFDLSVRTPDLIYEEVVEADERVSYSVASDPTEFEKIRSTTAEELELRQPLDLAALRTTLQAVFERGIRSLAICFLHSYQWPDHERSAARLAAEIGFTHVSCSSTVQAMIKCVPRGHTACADAYLTPTLKRYIDGFQSSFADASALKVLFMRSDGGLTPVSDFSGSAAIISGPAGGVVGYALTTFGKETQLPVIGFDMGGTSTDVSRYAGQFEHVFETTISGVSIQSPQLEMQTVAAGGGSKLHFRSGRFVVGPDSAGANPGPVAYKKGGPLCVTDANVVLGRLLPEYFPSIFGPDQDSPLDCAASLVAMERRTREINEFMSADEGAERVYTVQDVAQGYVDVANEAMCRPIRTLTQAKGFDTSRHALACFGGAGGQHACAIAQALGISQVVIHRYAGVLSAFGLALADVVCELQEPAAHEYSASQLPYLESHIRQLEADVVKSLKTEGFDASHVELTVYLNMRFHGTDCALMVTAAPSRRADLALSTGGFEEQRGSFVDAFKTKYEQEFGFLLQESRVIVDNIRVRGAGKTHLQTEVVAEQSSDTPVAVKATKCFFGNNVGERDTAVYDFDQLKAGQIVAGPALVVMAQSTVVVEPFCRAEITSRGNILIHVNTQTKEVGPELNPIQLSIFQHRFMSIAEQMGRILQRTSISTNIKERLDFSCAVFDQDGGLVSNAPHIPVHLGSMQEAVRHVLNAVTTLRPGDVFLSNHPAAGGTHLPDLTAITPAFLHDSDKKPVFFLASRGHHADIGGLTPGSMPPQSTEIWQEGAVFLAFPLVKERIFQTEALLKALAEPGTHPGCSGARNPAENISDLRSQIAANTKGAALLQELMAEYSQPVVGAYMKHIQQNAELAVRDLLRKVAKERAPGESLCRFSALDHMDDGTEIRLAVEVEAATGNAVFDFAGTGMQVWGNCNAPPAVVKSGIIYCLRAMVPYEIPLNQGCLEPITIKIPTGSILCPDPTAAVVGGNVLTSQRVCDVVLLAFRAAAASQGCMNNITFGSATSGYYETVAGGAGAGPTWRGRSGVHTHMTNTRITDPEILEKRYPVLLKQFSLRAGSGGSGARLGGDGVRRELLFRAPLTLSVLTERRVFAPYGLEGGESGSRGRNTLERADGRRVNLGSRCCVDVEARDVFLLETPGGGGHGEGS